MRKLALVSIAALSIGLMGLVPAAVAQDELNHGEIGVFGDYFRSSTTGNTNFAGLGARVSFNVHRFVQIEAETAYDFEKAFSEGFTDPTTGSISINRSNLRVLHGVGGFKIHAPLGGFRPFITLRGGVVNFRFDNRPITFGTFASSVDDLRTSNVKGVFEPGGGIEAFAGPIGIRIGLGDEMFWQGGVHHNLKATFGPQFRF
jgi:hypothetical protein